ncbi:LacI family DNA-binding transcriptional regulator [Tessaracoccus flavescens]|uniref:HTH lacI-type domain-containing protein n=1 Tax=Tessaracoccus flavescens TaxID=399497 RepID=A0A1Q2CVK1_9ACTN|nr:LacI family DNA-binding transcriptional regulator [Tessaracoccus flavescens]AQP50152.1 hypothetical protein BW733_04180 [Tessaracoccus flavescens]
MAGSKLEGEEETVIPARVKLADIAEIAGVSTATVSRVINEKPVVAETTRASVLAALEALGHPLDSPSPDQRDGLIAVIVPELGNPTFAAFANELSLQLCRSPRTDSDGGMHRFGHRPALQNPSQSRTARLATWSSSTPCRQAPGARPSSSLPRH